MSDLKVDYDVLADSVQTLAVLKSEFDGIKDLRDETSGLWGHRAVRDAMHGFASNMDYNRRKLAEEMAAVGEKLETTLETFREADAELAASFEDES